MTDTIVRVGNGQGFWGDSEIGPRQLVRSGVIDYLTLDYLAEVTMSILQKARSKNPDLGYAADFVTQLDQILPECVEKGIKIVANAGGINPRACAAAVAQVIERHGLDARVARVSGDDILQRLPEIFAAGAPLAHLSSGSPLEPLSGEVRSANAYLGAFPIAAALGRGADIVVTGRVTDASLIVGPLIHEFGWTPGDYDQLAAATIAGHIIECGTQCTGGNYDRWRDVPDLAGIGYPYVEVSANGDFVVTKPEGTGGLVDIGTVTAQLLYEIGDPRAYAGPDVVTDFTSPTLAQDGPDRVSVTGARGHAPTADLKVSVSLADGYRIVGQLVVGAPDAVEKAHLTAEILFERLRRDGIEFPDADRLVEVIGANTLYAGMPPEVPAPADPPEVLLRVAVRSRDRRALARLGAEIAPLLTTGPPGLTGFAGGRPRPSEVMRFWPALVPKNLVPAHVEVIGEET